MHLFSLPMPTAAFVNGSFIVQSLVNLMCLKTGNFSLAYYVWRMLDHSCKTCDLWQTSCFMMRTLHFNSIKVAVGSLVLRSV
jgi:hypothetical protein